MSLNRRAFVKSAVATSAAVVAVNAGLLTPTAVLADLGGAWNEAAFKAKDADGAINGVMGMSGATESTDIEIKAPAVAENGAVVPVGVDASALGAVESIAILADKNPLPLACFYEFGANATGSVSTRLKMGQTMNAVAVVKAGGKLYTNKAEIKVTIGGCGG